MEYHFKADDVGDLGGVASQIVDIIDLSNIDIVLLYGSMGAGKTTLVRALCESIGVVDSVTSPTFALVNEYERGSGGLIYHFDFYRIERLEEVFDLGYEEYLYSGNLSLIEWPEMIEPLIPYDDPSLKIARLDISVVSGDKREFTLTL